MVDTVKGKAKGNVVFVSSVNQFPNMPLKTRKKGNFVHNEIFGFRFHNGIGAHFAQIG